MLGRVDVDAMLDQITPEQFNEWLAYYRVEPFGDEWLAAATIAASSHNAGLMVAAAHGAKIDDEHFKKAEDFLPTFDKASKPKRLNAVEMEHVLRMMFPG